MFSHFFLIFFWTKHTENPPHLQLTKKPLKPGLWSAQHIKDHTQLRALFTPWSQPYAVHKVLYDPPALASILVQFI